MAAILARSLDGRLFSYQDFHIVKCTFKWTAEISNILAHLLAPYPKLVLPLDHGSSSLGIRAPAKRDSCLSKLKLQILIELFE